MNRRTALLLTLFAAAASLQADPAHGNPRLEKLFTTFISPCCWRANLLVHQSPKAGELRSLIEKQVAEGKTDDEIKAGLIGQYSGRILAMPEGAAGELLSWAPAVAVCLGMSAVALAIRHMHRPAFGPADGAQLPPLPDAD